MRRSPQHRSGPEDRQHGSPPPGRRPPEGRPPERRPPEGRPPEREVRQELVRLIGLLVDEPGQVDVRDERDRGGTRFEVHVAQQDLGKVIGRQGRTAWALRTLLEVRGAQDRRRYGLEIRDSRSP